MLARLRCLPTMALTLGVLLSLPGSTVSNPVQAGVRPRQPTPNPLDWLDVEASDVHPGPGWPPVNAGECAGGPNAGGLAFPHARFTDYLVGEVDCLNGVRLVFRGLPVGMSFSVIAVQVSGEVRLGSRAYLERVEVGIGYYAANSTTPEVIDTATEELRRQYRSGIGYSGVFNNTLNVFSSDPEREGRGRTSCATEGSQPAIDFRFWISASHERVQDWTMNDYQSTLYNVRFDFYVMWHQCGS